MDNCFTADFSDEPWWWRSAAPVDADSADFPEHTDVVVIGSGYSGLSCALELARSGTDVTVVEAGRLGSGASTRNAGFVSGRAGVSKQINLGAAVGEQRAAEILDEAEQGYQHFQHLISAENIDCQFKPVGRFVAANTPAAFEKLERKMNEYNQGNSGDQFEMVSRNDQYEFVNSDFFCGGMVVRNAGSIHPSLYHAGLLKLCRQAGVRFLSRTRVLGIKENGSGKHVQTDKGTLKTDQVALCTNGYTDNASTWHQRRVIPISSTVIATEELGTERVRQLLPKLCPIIDTKRVIYLARPTPDNKHILFGGRARFTPISATDSANILHRQMTQVFPDLRDVRITNAWSGLMAFTFDFLPKIGIHNNVHYAIGCNGGSGIVIMSWLGRTLGRNILGTTKQRSAFEGIPFKAQPFYSGNPWFLPIVGNWYRFRDWMELRTITP